MKKESTRIQQARSREEAALGQVNALISELGEHSSRLCAALNNLQALFDQIRNAPPEEKIKLERMAELKSQWKQQVEFIERSYAQESLKARGLGLAGGSAGVAAAALGPTAAMGIATTFGIASTGTAISTLSGAAAVNAALAWLGGGALAVGGGGMVAGQAFLTLFGPVGWSIAALSLGVTAFSLFTGRKEKKRLEDISCLIFERDSKAYELGIVELNERIRRIRDDTAALSEAIAHLPAFGTDYRAMTEAQQYALGTYFNLAEAGAALLVSPIMSLRPRFTEADYDAFCRESTAYPAERLSRLRPAVIALANALYKVELDDTDLKLYHRCLRKNKDFWTSMTLSAKDFSLDDLKIVEAALQSSYSPT